MIMGVWQDGTTNDDPIGRLAAQVQLALVNRHDQGSAVMERVMAEARKTGADGLVWAAVVLRLLAESAPSAGGDVDTWRRIGVSLDRPAWFVAAGGDAKARYDAVVEQVLAEHACTGFRPTMSEILDRMAALPAPVVVAGVLEFTSGFFDNVESEGLAPAFVDLVSARATARLAAAQR